MRLRFGNNLENVTRNLSKAMCFRLFKPLQILLLISLSAMTAPVKASGDNLHRVQDLEYGVSLFYFYQEKYFSAITELLVADHYQKINEDIANPQILLGGLYLSYGLHEKSTDIFEKLLEQDELSLEEVIQDRAWYLLGKNHFRNNLYDRSESSLKRVRDSLQQRDEDEKAYLLNTIFLKLEKIELAEDSLRLFSEQSIWKYYAQFNTGVYLIKQEDRFNSGENYLLELANLEAQNKELGLIKDKANLALAFVYLKNNDQDSAASFFEKVKVNSDVTGKALLGLGWSKYREEEFDGSISAWMNLASTQIESDLVVQEAMISIPYAFEKKTENEQALFQYDLALESYKIQLSETDELSHFIESQQFIDQVSPNNLGEETPKYVDVIYKLNPLAHRYLSDLIASKDFQLSVKQYQQLLHMLYKLEQWQHSLPALKMILEEKQKTYKNKLARTVGSESLDRVELLKAKHKQLASEVNRIESYELYEELAVPEEQDALKMLKALKQKLEKLKGDKDPDIEEVRFKYRLLNGLLAWRLKTEYPVRYWELKKKLRLLDNAVDQVQLRMMSLKGAWQNAPEDFSAFDKRIQNKEGQISHLKAKVVRAIKSQENMLRKMASRALYDHRNQLKLYHDRALFAKARLYDAMMMEEKQ